MMKTLKTHIFQNEAYALLEILIAIALLSTAVLPVYVSVSQQFSAISKTSDSMKASIYCRNIMNEFRIEPSKVDLKDKEIKDNPKFKYSIEIKRFEHVLLGPLEAKTVKVTVSWNENGAEKTKSLSYIYPDK